MPRFNSICRFLLIPAAGMLTAAVTAFGIINYGVDNFATTTHPENELGMIVADVPWDSVGRIRTADGSPRGSGVYLGGGYVLTAHHVGTGANVGVEFSTTGFIARDTSFAPVQLGTADLKIIRLASSPNLEPVQPWNGTENFLGNGLQIGWGVGRNPSVPVGTDTVDWGDNSTIAQRWGINAIQGGFIDTYESNGTIYTQNALFTILDNDASAFEGALTIYDSGSGIFQLINDTWYLTGIGYRVENGGASTFDELTIVGSGDDAEIVSRGDLNFYVAVNAFADEIAGVIPEPATTAALIALATLSMTLRRRHRSALAGSRH